MDQDLVYNIIGPGIVEFSNVGVSVDEAISIHPLINNRITSSPYKINHRLKNVQDSILKSLVIYADTYGESIHTLQWQEKYQALSVSAGVKIDNLNFNGSTANADGEIDYLPFTRKIVCFVFLNGQFEGGNFEFPYLGLTYSPKPDTILMLPADYMYSLSIRPVLSGSLLSLFTAFHGGKDIDEELYEEKKGTEFVPLSYMR